MIHDFCIIGGGIVGLATANELLLRRPGGSLVLIEKEAELTRHQTGHNSGVIHAGIYYEPGSLKAELCKQGNRRTKEFCLRNGIAFEECGKLVVATDTVELMGLEKIKARAQANGIPFEVVTETALREIEPNTVGVGAILVPSTGIVDYRRVGEAMASILRRYGAEIAYGSEIDAIQEIGSIVHVSTSDRMFRCRQLIVCGGLQADRLARIAGFSPDFRIVPFRGEYFRLREARSEIVRHLIYPVPDPNLPFLGVHLTRMIDGTITVGPNAVLSFARENYRKFGVNLRDVCDYFTYPGFWRMSARHWRSGLGELRDSLFVRGYLERCRRYCPSLGLDDFEPMDAGIRAQAVAADGALIHDFLFLETERMLHVCNAPSPAATSAMPIAKLIADRRLA